MSVVALASAGLVQLAGYGHEGFAYAPVAQVGHYGGHEDHHVDYHVSYVLESQRPDVDPREI